MKKDFSLLVVTFYYQFSQMMAAWHFSILFSISCSHMSCTCRKLTGELFQFVQYCDCLFNLSNTVAFKTNKSTESIVKLKYYPSTLASNPAWHKKYGVYKNQFCQFLVLCPSNCLIATPHSLAMHNIPPCTTQ